MSEADLSAWRDGRLPGAAFEAWLTDRVARGPSGFRPRQVYGAEDSHEFARRDQSAGDGGGQDRSTVGDGVDGADVKNAPGRPG